LRSGIQHLVTAFQECAPIPALRCNCPAKTFRKTRRALEYALRAADTLSEYLPRVAYRRRISPSDRKVARQIGKPQIFAADGSMF
jgi:hypothetical protein